MKNTSRTGAVMLLSLAMAAACLTSGVYASWEGVSSADLPDRRPGKHYTLTDDDSSDRGGTSVSDQQKAADFGKPLYTSSNVEVDGSVSGRVIEKDLKAAVEDVSGAAFSVRILNGQAISATVLDGIWEIAFQSGNAVTLKADTAVTGGADIQGCLYLEAEKLAGITGDIKLGVYTERIKTKLIKAKAEQWFSRAAVVSMAQREGFGARLKVGAKLDLGEMDTGNLLFYAFDAENGAYNKISNPSYTLGEDDFLYFYTEQAGDIVVTDRPPA